MRGATHKHAHTHTPSHTHTITHTQHHTHDTHTHRGGPGKCGVPPAAAAGHCRGARSVPACRGGTASPSGPPARETQHKGPALCDCDTAVAAWEEDEEDEEEKDEDEDEKDEEDEEDDDEEEGGGACR